MAAADDSTVGLRIREAVRALILDPSDRLLLVRFEFPAGTRWALPGGGIDDGESHADALRRELTEEIGLPDPPIGAHLWNRLHIIPFVNGLFDGQRDSIYEVRVPDAFEPMPAFTWEQLNAEHVFELRWWTLDELDASDVITAPSELRRLAREHIAIGPPPSPFDVGA